MRFFTNEEKKVVGSILLVIFIVTGINIFFSLKKSRDLQRQSDLGSILRSLNEFQGKYGVYPPSNGGKIVACVKDGVDIENLAPEYAKLDLYERLLRFGRPCAWGENGTMIGTIPLDPRTGQGRLYLYISNGKRFQVYASQEGKNEYYDLSVVGRKLACGKHICSIGKASGNTPVGKSIEEFELEIQDKER